MAYSVRVIQVDAVGCQTLHERVLQYTIGKLVLENDDEHPIKCLSIHRFTSHAETEFALVPFTARRIHCASMRLLAEAPGRTHRILPPQGYDTKSDSVTTS